MVLSGFQNDQFQTFSQYRCVIFVSDALVLLENKNGKEIDYI